jgi:hypothetical protein
MAKQKVATTYVVEIRTTSRYGISEDRYFRTKDKAEREIAELKEWFGPDSAQTFILTSHQILLT